MNPEPTVQLPKWCYSSFESAILFNSVWFVSGVGLVQFRPRITFGLAIGQNTNSKRYKILVLVGYVWSGPSIELRGTPQTVKTTPRIFYLCVQGLVYLLYPHHLILLLLEYRSQYCLKKYSLYFNTLTIVE
jgi:hypothetical protein